MIFNLVQNLNLSNRYLVNPYVIFTNFINIFYQAY